MMYQIKFPGRPAIPIQKPFFSVGTGAGCDAAFSESGESRIAFTLHFEGGLLRLLPGKAKVKVNGRGWNASDILADCDRLSWDDQACLVLRGDVETRDASRAAPSTLRCLSVVQKLAADLESESSVVVALEEALGALVEMAGAEVGHLLSDLGGGSGWEWLASVGNGSESLPGSTQRREMISNTILNEAVKLRRPVYVESLVGHPWAGQASLLGARLFSIAALPCVVGDRVLGCAYLFTRTPGRSIRRESLEELKLVVTQAALLIAMKAQGQRAKRERTRAAKGAGGAPMILFDGSGEDHPMRELDGRLTRLAASDLNLLVLGETGVGKELVAREVHARGASRTGPFIAVNCGAIPPSLMESTLFGFAKGAFTGAERDTPGKIAQADGGVLFLDEVGEMPLELQVKLLRVLQEKCVEPVGGTRAVPVRFRVVAATHQDLQAAIAQGKFRQDLFYRLNGAALVVPPLRQRGRDVTLLAEHFLAEISPELRLSESARRALEAHSWPGNVRELEQAITRAAALAGSGEIRPEDLELGSAAASPISAPVPELGDSLRDAQLRFTREYVGRVLDHCQGARSRAAALLGISERTLYRILAAES
jgi:DNA-binding NtrC family response regulator